MNLEDESKQSEFNSAIATLIRIDQIKKGLTIMRINRDMVNYYRYLESYFLELIGVLEGKDEESMMGTRIKVKQIFKDFRERENRGEKISSENVSDALIDWEVQLRNIEQKYGMGMLKKQDQRFALSAGGGRRG